MKTGFQVNNNTNVIIAITSTPSDGTFTLPDNFLAPWSIEVIGGGGGSGAYGTSSTRGGGGGGAYAKITQTDIPTLCAGSVVYVNVGAGGTTAGSDADASWVNVIANSVPTNTAAGVMAAGGSSNSSPYYYLGGVGGQLRVGSITYSGGDGGDGSNVSGNNGGGGGGGAAGPNGNGAPGGNGYPLEGGGGGGANGGGAGGDGAAGIAGSGGKNRFGGGGGSGSPGDGFPGTLGSGGSGGNSGSGGAHAGGSGSVDPIWKTGAIYAGVGPGAGSGGGSHYALTGTVPGTAGVDYGGGAGGSGGGYLTSYTDAAAGGDGIIIITYAEISDIGDPYPGRDEIIAYYPYLQGGLTSQMAWACGENTYYQTGLNTAATVLTPQTPSQSLPGVYSCSAGSLHGAKILTDGSLWTWGDATYGQTGLSITSLTSTPVRVGSGTTWRSVNCGFAHTMATKTDGSLWVWGRNNYGQLGNNDATLVNLSNPVQVSGTNWRLIQAGGYHTVALKTDNTMWAWGRNDYGQLGTLDNADTSYPVPIGSGYTWQSVSAGWLATYAIRSDGTLWAWGRNYYGQLGASLSTRIDYNSPVQVGSATNWKKVFAHGGNSVCAIKTDNSAWVWGANTNGQLGVNDLVNRSSPVQLGNQNVWHSVNIGMVHALAIKIDGSLWSWGYNYNGALAQNWPTGSSSPAQVGVSKNWKFVECGGANSDFFDNSPVIYSGGSAGWTIAVQSAADF